MKKLSPPGPLSQPSFAMVSLYLSLTALLCLGFAGAVPFPAPLHIPLVVKRGPLSVDEYWIAADALKVKYGVPYSSLSKRQTTAAIPITNRVCPPSTKPPPA